jgi:hypothetical protein
MDEEPRSANREFIQFLTTVFPDADAEQQREIRLTFFAGAWTVINMLSYVYSDDVSHEDGVAILNAYADEVNRTLESIVEARSV